ncbi:MAG: 3-hydroxyacyl-CoA dehydrogenase family protein [Deltaproteobacteria bacterium]|nr:3-hydroxyacyl-CoA dehydrogenase family protein [Deltaproteobacteria bacterium]MBW2050175.1 3-hydroxyacyl-CoA dehydrogenase family protein [Deltaproteobacteria bacterium]
MSIKKVFVAGSGAMGSGIVQSCAQAGYSVKIMDMDESAVKKALAGIEWSLKKLEEKNRFKEAWQDILLRIEHASSLSEAGDADMVIEAIFENLEPKQRLFADLEAVCPGHTIFSTNTSSIPVTEIASAVRTPERVVGIHFFNPVHRMKLVEVVKGLLTSEETVSMAAEFARTLGKEPVVVNRDSAGFIVNRINGMAFLEALRLVEKGIAEAEDIDKAVRLGLGHPMGPFELMDMVGLDIVLNARMGVYNETRDLNHFPPNILRRMVKAGRLGRKTGKGFYDYSE